MKYLLEAIKETKQLKSIIFYTIIDVIIMVLELVSIRLLTMIFSKNFSMYLVAAYVIAELLSLIILIIRRGRILLGRDVYTYLANKYSAVVMNMEHEFFVKHSPGEIQSIFKSLNNMSNFCYDIITIITQILHYIVIVAALGLIDIKAALIISPIVPLFTVIYRKTFNKWNQIDSKVVDTKNQRDKWFDDSINGFKEVKSNNLFNQRQQRFEKLNATINDLVKNRLKVTRVTTATIGISKNIVIFIAITIGVILVNNGSISSSAALSMVLYCGKLIDPLVTLSDIISVSSETLSDIRKVATVFDYQNKVPDGTITLDSFNSDIEINDLDFSYNNSRLILQNVSLKIIKGMHIGICGTTGEGKSTLLKLLSKQYIQTNGSIKIDGLNVSDITTESLNDHIGIVHQDTFIFDGTIKDNITFGKNVSDVQFNLICKVAQIDRFVKLLKDGYETKVGPRGLKLSGGQQQRIALARLLVKDPEIYLLDEATSALDNETEKAVQNAIDMYLMDKTVITVAHRLSTIRNSDMIIIINNHTIAESGAHEELIKKEGLYYNMFTAAKKK